MARDRPHDWLLLWFQSVVRVLYRTSFWWCICWIKVMSFCLLYILSGFYRGFLCLLSRMRYESPQRLCSVCVAISSVQTCVVGTLPGIHLSVGLSVFLVCSIVIWIASWMELVILRCPYSCLGLTCLLSWVEGVSALCTIHSVSLLISISWCYVRLWDLNLVASKKTVMMLSSPGALLFLWSWWFLFISSNDSGSLSGP